jgi:hypothetical protein
VPPPTAHPDSAREGRFSAPGTAPNPGPPSPSGLS